MSAVEITDDIGRLTRERDEARAYLKAFVYATIDPEDGPRQDVQLHKANPSLGWYFTLNDTGMRGHREILGSQIRRAMEIVGFDKLKIERAETTVADDHVAAIRRAHKAETTARLALDCLRSFPGFTDDASVGDPWAERKNAILSQFGGGQ